jgi:uncharacterized alkaline shock family protein YloU
MATELAPGIRIADTALAHVVSTAAESVEGVRIRRPKRDVEISTEGGRARVSLELTAQHGRSLADLGRGVQEQVGTALRTMCGLEPTAVDVTIEELE